MLDWNKHYRIILEDSGLWVPLLAGFVDDGRQGSTVLAEGSRFCKETNKFDVNLHALAEDIDRGMLVNQ